MGGSVSVGIVGCGPMGRELLRGAMGSGIAEVCALCDLEAEAMDAGAEVIGNASVARFTDYREMLAKTDCDGVIVAVPQYLHAEVSIAALQAGRGVFCEKPMSLTVDDCRRMIASAESAGRPLMIGQVLRYLGPYRYIKELVASGEFGKPRAMRVIRSMDHWRPEHNPWRCTRAESGGLLYEVNIHEIDLMLCVLGRAARVTAQGNRLINLKVDYEDHISVGIEFEDGAIGHVTSSICDYLGRNAGEIFCERGTIYYDSLTEDVRIRRPDSETQVIPYGEIGKDYEPPIQREVREFLEACRGDHPAPIPGIDGLRAVAICQAAYESAASGCSVDVVKD